jgi:thiosulfate/3-mercaptopyruvate sulfurtransferase
LNTFINGESLLDLVRGQHPDLILVDTRSFAEYAKGHIPGAINIDLMHFHWFDTSTTGILHFEKQMSLLLNYLGINPSNRVIFYDNVSGPTASRGVWLLNYFAHPDSCMLDGGFENWSRLKYPVEMKTNQYSHSTFNFHTNRSILADLEYVKICVDKNSQDVIIVDCRSEAEYNGSVARAFHRGHIPKSVNVEWSNNLSNEKFLKFDALVRLYSFISKDTEVITYCQGGYRAANTYLVLKQLGYPNVRMYLGSWGEWGNNPTLPVELN